ncbi:MAG: cobalamin-binding protein [Dehalococcoidia bacterium]|nr:cobalamin-binding protein [Dehalococcoidia bacterium]
MTKSAAALPSFRDTGLPQRIVCLTGETAEFLYRMGAGDLVVGVSGVAKRPPEVRQKPTVGGFTSVNVEKVLALGPDLVISFSDLQAEPAKELIARGIQVLALNQRSLRDILNICLLLGAVVGREAEARRLAEEMRLAFEAAADEASRLSFHPGVYFEEWHQPLISGISWVSELIELAGGRDVFPEMRACSLAAQRVVDPQEVVRRNPDVILASWCSKKVVWSVITERPGWDQVAAVRNGQLYEIPSPDILQPGPAILEGLRQVRDCVRKGAARRV